MPEIYINNNCPALSFVPCILVDPAYSHSSFKPYSQKFLVVALLTYNIMCHVTSWSVLNVCDVVILIQLLSWSFFPFFFLSISFGFCPCQYQCGTSKGAWMVCIQQLTQSSVFECLWCGHSDSTSFLILLTILLFVHLLRLLPLPISMWDFPKGLEWFASQQLTQSSVFECLWCGHSDSTSFLILLSIIFVHLLRLLPLPISMWDFQRGLNDLHPTITQSTSLTSMAFWFFSSSLLIGLIGGFSCRLASCQVGEHHCDFMDHEVLPNWWTECELWTLILLAGLRICATHIDIGDHPFLDYVIFIDLKAWQNPTILLHYIHVTY